MPTPTGKLVGRDWGATRDAPVSKAPVTWQAAKGQRLRHGVEFCTESLLRHAPGSRFAELVPGSLLQASTTDTLQVHGAERCPEAHLLNGSHTSVGDVEAESAVQRGTICLFDGAEQLRQVRQHRERLNDFVEREWLGGWGSGRDHGFCGSLVALGRSNARSDHFGRNARLEPVKASATRSWSGTRLSGPVEDGVRAYPTPEDVRLAFGDSVPILEGRSSVVGPRHLEDAGRAFHTLDAKALAEPATAAQVLHELSYRDKESGLLALRQRVEVRAEAGQP